MLGVICAWMSNLEQLIIMSILLCLMQSGSCMTFDNNMGMGENENQFKPFLEEPVPFPF